jgi:hypothetical protein
MRTRWMLTGLTSLIVLTAAAGPARAYSPLTFHGGPVMSPVIYPVFWGDWSSTETNAINNYLTGLAAYLSGTPTTSGQRGVDPVTRQYGVVGATVGSGVTSTNKDGFSTVNEGDVLRKISQLQSQGSLPARGPNRLFAIFLKGFQYSFLGHPGGCAFHSFSSGTYYAVMPSEWLTNPDGQNCSMQDATSHELMEAATDPEPSAGWATDEGFGGFTHSEGGDSCLAPGGDQPMTFGHVQMFADNSTGTCQSFIYSTTPHFAVTKVAGHVLDAVWPTPDPATLRHAWFDGSTWQSETMTAPASQTSLNFVGSPAVVSASANRIDVFARAVNGELLHVYKDYGNSNGWIWTFKLQGGVGAPSAATYTTNRIDLAFMNWDATTGHSWSNDGGNGFFTENWPSRIAGSVKIVALKNAKLDVYTYGSDLRLNVKTFDNTWSGFFQLTGTSGYTGLTPAVATSDFWFNRAVLLDRQKWPLVLKYTTPPQATSDSYNFGAGMPPGNVAWGAMDMVGNAQGFDAAWQDWNEGTFYYSHFDMQSLGWTWVNDGSRWGRVRLGGVYASPPLIAYGGDGKIYVTGIGMDGCLWYTNVAGTTVDGPYPTGQCGMY